MKNLKKIISIITLVVVIVNFLLLVFGRNNWIAFWSVTIICAIIAYKIVPKIS